MTTINLYQNQEDAQLKNSSRAANGGFYFSLGILVLTLGVLFGIKFYVASLVEKNKVLAEDVTQQNKNLAGVSSLQRILDMQTKLDQIKNNLQINNGTVGQLRMTEVLDRLGSDLGSDVVVSSFSFDGGKVKISFNAGNYNSAARQILNFKKSAYFSNATLGNVVRTEKSVTVDMTMDVTKKNNEVK